LVLLGLFFVSLLAMMATDGIFKTTLLPVCQPLNVKGVLRHFVVCQWVLGDYYFLSSHKLTVDDCFFH